MIIKNIKHIETEGFITVSADVRVDAAKEYDNVYFKLRKSLGYSVCTDGTAFVALTLFIAMWRGEDINIEGTISSEFYLSLNKIMELLTSWDSNFKKINVNFVNLIPDKYYEGGSSCFFSLGVDSFYTYLKHKSSKHPINNLIFVHGFDIDLENKFFSKETLQKIDEVARKETINVFSIETNLRKFTDRYLDWDWEHGGAMAATSLLLRSNFNKTYFAGSDSSTQRGRIIPYGTHPLLDPLWLTETFRVVHDGNEATRIQKIQNVVSKSKLALSYLRVCNQNLKGMYNCSKCEKCIRTMIDLKISGALNQATTFKNFIPLDKLAQINNSHFDTKIYFEDSLKALRKINKFPDLQHAIEKSLQKSAKPPFHDRLIKYLSKIDKNYNKGRINNFIFGTTQNGDRKLIFKILADLSLIR